MTIFRKTKEMDFIYFALILAQISRTIGSEPTNLVKAIATLQENEIKMTGYLAETHFVTTEDGYVLTVFRIPGSRGSKPVYMHHGLEESGADWLAPGKGKSLAYILHDEGYDVWLGNTRGNLFSKKHINLTTDDPQFWDFSISEVGIYDLPAVINHITNLSGKKLFFIGHSMAGAFMSIMCIERPDVAQKVNVMIGLAPGPYVANPKSLPIVLLVPFWKQLYAATKLLNIYEFLPHSKIWDAFANNICGSKHLRTICSLVTFITAGYSPEHTDYPTLQKFWRYFPAGTSVKLYVHYLQQLQPQTRFNKFDYGKETNLKIYDSILPPAYDLSKMRLPTAVFWADNDLIVVSQEIKKFYSQIPIRLGIYQVPDKTFNHFDYVISKDAASLVYPTVLKIMTAFDKRNN